MRETAGEMAQNSRQADSLVWRTGAFRPGERTVPEEVAVAISVNGSTHAVMMATPDHIRELGIGLALNERIIDRPEEIERIEIAETNLGIDCRLWLSEARARTYVARRRQMTGPVGCGLCGVESLELAVPELPNVESELRLEPGMVGEAVAAMARSQPLGRETRAVHAAGFYAPGSGQLVVREDVGRHNALDKVAGHLAETGVDPKSGIITLTSRVSVELIQKAAVMGCGIIAAVSAPTQLAIEAASQTGITLVAVVRGEEFEVFSHFRRLAGAEAVLDEGIA